MRRVAVVSNILPPSPSGQAVILGKLLEGLAPDEYVLLSKINYAEVPEQPDLPPRLSAPYYWLPPAPRLTIWEKPPLRYLRKAYTFSSTLSTRARQIATLLKRERCTAAVACTGDPYDLPATYLACKLTGARFFPYIFDYFSYQWIDPLLRASMERVEAFLLRGASGVFVTNEFMRDEYRRRYGCDTLILRNPCDLAEAARAEPRPINPDATEIRIVFTGAVYVANLDAFVDLIRALERRTRPNVRLHIYTAENPDELQKAGLCGPVVFHPHVGMAEVFKTQREADLLFLPLAFDSPFPELIHTATPGKMGEYLVSGRPVLVHAPAGCYLSWYFREHDCGLVVDQKDPAALAQALDDLLQHPARGVEMAERARARAREDFDLVAARETFRRAVLA